MVSYGNCITKYIPFLNILSSRAGDRRAHNTSVASTHTTASIHTVASIHTIAVSILGSVTAHPVAVTASRKRLHDNRWGDLSQLTITWTCKVASAWRSADNRWAQKIKCSMLNNHMLNRIIASTLKSVSFRPYIIFKSSYGLVWELHNQTYYFSYHPQICWRPSNRHPLETNSQTGIRCTCSFPYMETGLMTAVVTCRIISPHRAA